MSISQYIKVIGRGKDGARPLTREQAADLFGQVLADRLGAALRRAGLAVFEPHGAGCGDAGLALGQAWIAACAVRVGGTALRCEPTPAFAAET